MRRPLLLSIDLACVCVATLLALLLRDNLEPSLDRFRDVLPYLGISLLSAAVLFPLLGIDRGIWRYSSLSDCLRIMTAVLIAVLGAVALGFAVNRLDGVPRALPILQAVLLVGLMTIGRVLARLRHSRRSRPPAQSALRGEPLETLLVVGVGHVAELFLHSVKEFAQDRIHIAGVIGRHGRQGGRLFHNHVILGAPEEISSVLRELEVHGVFVNRIVVTVGFDRLSRGARDSLADIEVSSDIVIDYFAERVGFAQPRKGRRDHPPTSTFGGEPEIDPNVALRELVSSGALDRPYWKWKRASDSVVALGFMILLSPLIAFASLLAVLDVGPEAFFWQIRPGAFGRPFKLYKLRTMRGAHDQNGRRIPDEERSSAIGRFLRRSRLDELPQLFNIVIGEMSFVGPRPLLPVDQAPEHCARLAVRPGLTGWAQVNGGREVPANDKAALDVWYVHNASFRLDLIIALRTLRMVLFGERANAVAVRQAWQDLTSKGALFPILPSRGPSTSDAALHRAAQRRVA